MTLHVADKSLVVLLLGKTVLHIANRSLVVSLLGKTVQVVSVKRRHPEPTKEAKDLLTTAPPAWWSHSLGQHKPVQNRLQPANRTGRTIQHALLQTTFRPILPQFPFHANHKSSMSHIGIEKSVLRNEKCPWWDLGNFEF